jgi:hypothetical protein
MQKLTSNSQLCVASAPAGAVTTALFASYALIKPRHFACCLRAFTAWLSLHIFPPITVEESPYHSNATVFMASRVLFIARRALIFSARCLSLCTALVENLLRTANTSSERVAAARSQKNKR